MPKMKNGLQDDEDNSTGPPNPRRKTTRKETILSLVEMLLQSNDNESSVHGAPPFFVDDIALNRLSGDEEQINFEDDKDVRK